MPQSVESVELVVAHVIRCWGWARAGLGGGAGRASHKPRMEV
jgi:hypothetical protein